MIDIRSGDQDVRAALLYDRPTLLRSQSFGAKAFVEILDLRWNRDDDVEDTPLGVAATGLKDIFSGNRDSGRARFESLLRTQDDDDTSTLIRLLGHALLAWSSETDEREILAAATEAGRSHDDHLVALYLLKLAGFALDSGDKDLASGLITESLARVPAERERLQWRLHYIAASLNRQILFSPSPADADDLAEFPWIDGRAATVAQESLRRLAEAHVADPWRRTIQLGTTPVDSLTAAVLQAEWAGAIWLLPQLRLQQASMTIVSGARDTEEWERAAANWVLGGGSRLRDVIRAVEAHFEAGSTRRLIDEHLVRGRRLRRPEQYLQVLLALWDLLDDELAEATLREIPSLEVRGADRDDKRALWTLLGALVPGQWSNHLAQLTAEEQSAVLPHLTVGLVQRLPRSAIRVLAERCVAAIAQSLEAEDVPGPDFFEAAAALLRAEALDDTGRASLLKLLSRTPRDHQIEIVTQVQELAAEFDVASLMRESLRFIDQEASAARRGRYTMYARPPISTAARLAIAYPDVDPAESVAEGILDLAFDSTLIVDFRMDALEATYQLALSHHFDEQVGRRSEQGTEFQSDAFRPPQDVLLQRAILDCAFFVSATSVKQLPAVLAHVRESDPRVRRLAVRAIGDRLDRGSESAGIDRLLLWSSLVGALFDPAPSVVELSLDLIARIASVPKELTSVVAERLLRLFSESGRDVRASVVRAAASWTVQRPSVSAILEDVLTQAAADRSWLVRDVRTVATKAARST